MCHHRGTLHGGDGAVRLAEHAAADAAGRADVRAGLDRRHLTRMSETKLTKLRRCGIGFVFQAFNHVNALTVEEDLVSPGRSRTTPGWATRRSGGLRERLHHLPSRCRVGSSSGSPSPGAGDSSEAGSATSRPARSTPRPADARLPRAVVDESRQQHHGDAWAASLRTPTARSCSPTVSDRARPAEQGVDRIAEQLASLASPSGGGVTRLALRMLRHRPGSAVATLIALRGGVMILMAMGALVESGLRYAAGAAAADVVVANRDLTVTTKTFGEVETSTVGPPEGGTVPADLVGRIRAVPGVATVAADATVAGVGPWRRRERRGSSRPGRRERFRPPAAVPSRSPPRRTSSW